MEKNRTVLVTGGTGYIGSHTCVVLLQAGYQVVILDNLSNSKREVAGAVGDIAGAAPVFYEGDLRDSAVLERVFSENDIFAVIHFAGMKAVGESVRQPLAYYENNVTGTIRLLEAMTRHEVKNIVFSSSATVYGDRNPIPYVEGMPVSATSPYGYTKVMIEQILTDLHTACPDLGVSILRYFNPIGAHESGRIGENPNGIPNNLMPYITQVGIGRLPFLGVFGDDYNTPDGTGVRDYIHVMDLAEGHEKALGYLEAHPGSLEIFNLGTGKGTSVLELVHAFSEATGVEIPYRIQPRRPGDIDAFYADASRAKALLGWQATRGLEEMCKSSWNFTCQAMK